MYPTYFVCANSWLFNNKKYNILYRMNSITIIYLAENVQLNV